MKRQWITLLLFLITLLGILLSWNWRHVQHFPQMIPASYPQPVEVFSDTPISFPPVNADRLLSDLKNLSFPRSAEADRQLARRYILEQLEAAGWKPQMQRFENGINIYADRPGTDPNGSVILLGAHYDSVESSPGADDNATAVATTLEAARLFQKEQTLRTLRVVFFDAEEKGLLGSIAYVEQLEEPAKLQGAVIMDMLGYRCNEPGCQTYPSVLPVKPPNDRGNFLAVIGDQGHPALTDSFTDANQPGLPQILSLSIPTFGGFTPDLVRSDHAPFWRAGIGAVLVTDTANFRNPHYHQPTDTIDTIDRSFFSGSAQTVINAIAILLQGGTS
ncbi:MAG TPA: M20/M25/M40 family metallo-hydrolase [Trichocoleus sp.]|jgi:hypothetical protein